MTSETSKFGPCQYRQKPSAPCLVALVTDALKLKLCPIRAVRASRLSIQAIPSEAPRRSASPGVQAVAAQTMRGGYDSPSRRDPFSERRMGRGPRGDRGRDRKVVEGCVREDVVREDATAQSKPPVREDVVREARLAASTEPALRSYFGHGLLFFLLLAPRGQPLEQSARHGSEKRHPSRPTPNRLARRLLILGSPQVAGLIGYAQQLMNETLRDRRETEERRVEQWRRSQAADVKSAQAEQKAEMAKTKMIQANAVLDAAKVAFASSSGSQSAKAKAEAAAERILKELDDQSDTKAAKSSSSSSSSESSSSSRAKKKRRPAVKKAAKKKPQTSKGAKKVSKSRGRR
ncbi:hypothetical protein AK812_SmicGene14471 [Symbiodinium microadriaticum]|uniref:Uncharacterized protein n=1 Tax=Symbiodinium microadriaticum TaxID=2951 RepID=A0A1Q9E5D7_SYMMI|nr:hypothetical protein AK812_SmicGene14471 [Symbiodinium microadriaticum]